MLATNLTVIANRDCPHCVQALDMLTERAWAEGVPISAADLSHHPELAATWNAETSPYLIFDGPGGFHTFAGIPDAAQFHALASPP